MARAYNNRATAYAEQHQYQQAIADFTKAISLDPRGALTYRNRGLAYHDLGQLNQAIEDYTVAIRLDPSVFEGPSNAGMPISIRATIKKRWPTSTAPLSSIPRMRRPG